MFDWVPVPVIVVALLLVLATGGVWLCVDMAADVYSMVFHGRLDRCGGEFFDDEPYPAPSAWPELYDSGTVTGVW